MVPVVRNINIHTLNFKFFKLEKYFPKHTHTHSICKDSNRFIIFTDKDIVNYGLDGLHFVSL